MGVGDSDCPSDCTEPALRRAGAPLIVVHGGWVVRGFPFLRRNSPVWVRDSVCPSDDTELALRRAGAPLIVLHGGWALRVFPFLRRNSPVWVRGWASCAIVMDLPLICRIAAKEKNR